MAAFSPASLKDGPLSNLLRGTDTEREEGDGGKEDHFGGVFEDLKSQFLRHPESQPCDLRKLS